MLGNLVFVDPVVLNRVESRIHEILKKTGVLAILLLDKSGVVLAYAGEMPMHPVQMGGVAAGVFSAMKVMLKGFRTENFVITVPSSSSSLEFQAVDDRMFLCAFYGPEQNAVQVREELGKLALESRNSIEATQPCGERVTNTDFIEEKLNEIFGKPGSK